MNYYIIRSSEDGISIDGPMTRAAVAATLDCGRRESERDPVLLDKVPEQDKGCFWRTPEGAMVVLRGEVVGLDQINACPCESGALFSDCHGQIPMAEPGNDEQDTRS